MYLLHHTAKKPQDLTSRRISDSLLSLFMKKIQDSHKLTLLLPKQELATFKEFCARENTSMAREIRRLITWRMSQKDKTPTEVQNFMVAESIELLREFASDITDSVRQRAEGLIEQHYGTSQGRTPENSLLKDSDQSDHLTNTQRISYQLEADLIDNGHLDLNFGFFENPELN